MTWNRKSIIVILIAVILLCFGIWYVKADIPEVWTSAEAGICDLTEINLDA